jgi:hypothetical protein
LGEIVLVVIGILIALSINNWNENSKERKFERKMLSEIQLALQNDIAYFENNVNRLYKLDSSIEVMLGFIEEGAVFVDSLYNNPNKRSYNLAIGIIYQYNPGPYEALKATGVDKIKNDSLRKELITLYDFEFPRNQEFVTYYDLDYRSQIETFFGFMDDSFIETVNGKKVIYSKLPPDLLKRPKFLDLLSDMRSRARLQIRGFNGFIPNLNRVDSLLSQELVN